MAQNTKQPPSIAPEQHSLSENLALAIKDERIRRGFTVTMKVRGGIPSQAYSLDFSAAGNGTVECRFECHLSGRKGQSEKTKLAAKDMADVSDGTSMRRFYFAADPEQAKTQGKIPPPELLQAVDAIYAIGAKLTGNRRIKP